MSEPTPATPSPFAKFFLPGLVLGVVIGTLLGALITPILADRSTTPAFRPGNAVPSTGERRENLPIDQPPPPEGTPAPEQAQPAPPTQPETQPPTQPPAQPR